MAAKPASRRQPKPSAGKILTAALDLAEQDGWATIRMMHIAKKLGVGLADIHRHHNDMDAIANAWFDQAFAALLASPPAGFTKRSPADRLSIVITRWLDALAAHRRVSAQMLGQKLYLSHPQHWGPMVFSLSRLVHGILDAAGIDSHRRQRQVEELGTTFIVLATLRMWCKDDSEDQERTKAFLRTRLAQGDRVMARLFGGSSG